MGNWYIIGGAVGIVCVLAALVGLGMAFAHKGWWGLTLCCLASFALITFLTLVGIDASDIPREGKS